MSRFKQYMDIIQEMMMNKDITFKEQKKSVMLAKTKKLNFEKNATENFQIKKVTFRQIIIFCGNSLNLIYQKIKKIVGNTFPSKKIEDFVKITQKGDLFYNKKFLIFKIVNGHQAYDERDTEVFYIVYDKINKKLYYDFTDSGENEEAITNVLKEAEIDASNELIEKIKDLNCFTSYTYQ